jgi:hypothetical protein
LVLAQYTNSLASPLCPSRLPSSWYITMEALKEAKDLATVCLPVDLCSIYLAISHLANTSKIQDPGYSCNGAACCDNGSCAGTDQTCCGDGICDAGYGCCENKGCVLLADTCCDDGGYCPAGQGCFSYDNSPQIFCSPTGGGTHPATSTVKPESTTSSINQQTSVVHASSSVYYYTYE